MSERDDTPAGGETARDSGRESRPELDDTGLQSEAPPPQRSPRPPRRDRTLDIGGVVSRYEILRRIGEGGMGTVYAAHDPQLDREVAIKILHTSSDEAAIRLQREAQALAKLEHPNVVTVYDSGEHGDMFFIVMQLVHGDNLARALRQGRRTPEAILALFVAAGRGLAAAHAAGIVHRDFKPANVLVDEHGRVAVTDFGLARSVDDPTPEARRSEPPRSIGASGTARPALTSARWSDHQLTQAGAILGTPAYMAPEQHRGLAVAAAADQFSFCVALWEAIYQQHPLLTPDVMAHGTQAAVGSAVIEGAIIPPPPRRVPKSLQATLRRGLAVDPAARWESMDALLDQLAPRAPRRRGVVAGLAVVAVVASSIALWATTRSVATAPPSCAATTDARVTAVWSPATLATATRSFAATGQPFADRAATRLGARLGDYAVRWHELAMDQCLAERNAPRVDDAVRTRRAACLDSALADLRTLAHAVTGVVSVDTLAHVDELAAALPALGDCSRAAALRDGPGVPPAPIAPRVQVVRDQLVTAKLAIAAGAFVDARRQLDTLTADAVIGEWPALGVETGLARGELALDTGDAVTADLIAVAGHAVELGMESAAAQAWALAMQSAAFQREASQQEALETIASATAHHTGEPSLVFRVAHARALALLTRRQWARGLAACRALLPLIDKLPAGQDRARYDEDRCEILALQPMGKWDEVDAHLTAALAFAEHTYGPDHPDVATLLLARANGLERVGKHAEGRALVDRAIAVRSRAFGPAAVQTLDARAELITYDVADEHFEVADQRGAELLALAGAIVPAPLHLLYRLHRDLGTVAQVREDIPRALAELEAAIGLADQIAGPTSVDTALLMIMAGQYRSLESSADGIALLHRAGEILQAAGDRRAMIALGAEAMVLYQDDRWADAAVIYERVLAALDANVDPGNRARLRFQLARCLRALHRDPDRVRELATLARADFALSGGTDTGMLPSVDAFLRKR